MNFFEKLLSDYDFTLDKKGVSGKRLASRLAALSEIGLTPDNGSHRIGFSHEEKAAKDLVKQWMTEAGLTVTEDGAGNVFGRLNGNNPDLPALLSGSHVDSVPNGGHFDGPLGVLAALEVAEAWKQTGFVPERPFEVVIFSDEEGARFNGGFSGSSSMIGEATREELLPKIDIHGDSFTKVLEDIGLSVDDFFNSKRDLKQLEAFVEIHIEQGKRLERAGVPVGIVTGIAGPCWLIMTFTGSAGHAGNTPMDDRRDALVAASQFIYEVQALPAQVSSSAVATVGKVDVLPNGVNVIPGEVRLTVDIRDIKKETRDQLVDLVIEKAKAITEEHGIELQFEETLREAPVPISKDMRQKLEKSVIAQGIEPVYLPSGAGHDSMIVGHVLPVAMIFVQSKDGISHNPAEWSSLSDCVQSVHVLKDFLEGYDR
ncbi:Zn-dependent hydrolase [Bacillus timonensis]|uniref:Zn-dependent hydrolase n=1 Tax=Bacillus timonensis TaxID=1033734 RepID=A0A4S3PQP9_9BACI|nr:M20 family metallo-hydrolase [Bacillus timonensis]THE11939.1 Zn-dependent hydrolase [Bacillus timonensis]